MNKVINQVSRVERKVFYAGVKYDRNEIEAVVKSLENSWLANGPLVAEFEKKVASLFGKKYGIAVNSGSSANLLAFASLDLPKNGTVITPALTFSTTVSPIVINNLVPRFVDGVIGRYTINEALVEQAIDSTTVAIMVPQLIGGLCDMKKLRDIADKYHLKLIDDSCDTFAPKIGEKNVSSYSDITTTSFYGSHIITAMGVGGMLLTDDEDIKNAAVTMRDWGRVGSDQEGFEDRFNFQIDNIPYDGKFLYSHLGFNLKLNEACAAFGLEQLKRLPESLKRRKDNWNSLHALFEKYEAYFHLPELIANASTNWLAFPLTLKPNAPFSRYDFLKHLESDGIQTRVLFSGNITRHPVMKKVKYEVASDLTNADIVMASGFLLGAHHAMGPSEISIIRKSVENFIKNL